MPEPLPPGNDELIAGTSSQPDRALMQRLTLMNNPASAGNECFDPLDKVILEALAWVIGAIAAWVAAAVILG